MCVLHSCPLCFENIPSKLSLPRVFIMKICHIFADYLSASSENVAWVFSLTLLIFCQDGELL